MESLQEIRNLLHQKNKLQEQAQVFQNQIQDYSKHIKSSYDLQLSNMMSQYKSIIENNES
jgi:tRNA1(Val) A37 N6-methylase TrmN6